MFWTVLGSAAMAASPSSAIDVELVGHQARDTEAGEWHRYDVRFTNEGKDAQTLSVCPNDAQLYAWENAIWGERRPSSRLLRIEGFATAFDRNNWSYNCSRTAIGAEESVVLSLYFDYWQRGDTVRPIVFETSLGRYAVQDGVITQVAPTDGDADATSGRTNAGAPTP